MNKMGGETGKAAFSKELSLTKSWTIPWLDTPIKLREKWKGRAVTRKEKNEWEGETEKDAFSKKSCYIQKMEMDNVWAKKYSAADCSTKQNRMAFRQADAALVGLIVLSTTLAFPSGNSFPISPLRFWLIWALAMAKGDCYRECRSRCGHSSNDRKRRQCIGLNGL